MRIELEVDSTTGEARIVSKQATRSTPAADEGIVYPYRDPDAQGHLFMTKAEHDDWKRRVAERYENLMEVARNQLLNDPVLQPGAWDIRQATNEDAAFEWTFTFELCNNGLVGPMGSIHRLHSWIYDGTTETNAEFPGLTGAALRVMCKGAWDWTGYTGPLRAILEKHRGGPL